MSSAAGLRRLTQSTITSIEPVVPWGNGRKVYYDFDIWLFHETDRFLGFGGPQSDDTLY
jgi:hypothetical protein